MSSLFDKNKKVDVYRKGEVLKTVTAQDFSDAVNKSEYASEWPDGKLENYVLLTDKENRPIRDENGNQLALPTNRKCYWLFSINGDGDVVDYSNAFDYSESYVGLFKEFNEMLGFETQVWYVGRDIGIRRLS